MQQEPPKEQEEEEAVTKEEPKQEDLIYNLVSPACFARVEIAKYCARRITSRMMRAVNRKMDGDYHHHHHHHHPHPDEDLDAKIDWALKQASSLVPDYSNKIGDDHRPLSGCSFSHGGDLLATYSASGVARIWSMPQLKKVSAFEGHTQGEGSTTYIAFPPTDTFLATSSFADSTARLWNTEGSLLQTFRGHSDGLAHIAFHPSGKCMGTTSLDKPWRLWDIETGEGVLKGLCSSADGISFHLDGSLVATCGSDAMVRIWRLLHGRNIFALEGQAKPVLSISFSPNRSHLATGGEYNSCRIWDVNMRKSFGIIPAHSSLISQVKFEREDGCFW